MLKVISMTKNLIPGLLVLSILLFSCKDNKNTALAPPVNPPSQNQEWAIVIHGGAGGMSRERMDTETENQYRASLSGSNQ